MLPAVCVFAVAFGVLAAAKGLDIWQALGMSLFVYAGLSQMMGLQLWQEVWTWSGLFAVALVVFSVNLRMVLMGAALYPHFSRTSSWKAYLLLPLLTDANFILTAKYEKEGGKSLWFFAASGGLLLLVWIAFTPVGFYLAGTLGDVKRIGFDLFLPIFFGIMSISLLKIKRDKIVWPVVAVSALIFSHYVEGYWFIVFGATLGAVLGGVLHERA